MPAVPSRDISMQANIGSIHVYMNAEGVSWNPDVADDMHARLMQMLAEMCLIAAEYGPIEAIPDAEEIDASVTDNRELTSGTE